MSAIVIGNRKVGKTSMVVALARGTKHIEVIEPQSLIEKSNPNTGKIAPTFRQEEESLVLRVQLPSGYREVTVRWIDTPGEAWSEPQWRLSNPEPWQDLVQAVSQSQAVLLLLPPYRRSNRPSELEEPSDADGLLDAETWKTELTTRLKFLRETCPRVQHILISLHKADLLSYFNLEREEKNWQYDDRPNTFRWFEYDSHIRKTYFDLADDIIRQHNAQPPYLNTHFFVTSIYHQTLLELPWVYLASHLAYASNNE
jgi:hypothetical protein